MLKDHAYRTVTATIDNQSGETLELEPPGAFAWGQWLGGGGPPPAIGTIAPGAKGVIFVVETAYYLTGCEGRLSFKIGKTGNRWEITWNNPFLGWNEYKQYVNGQEYAAVANNDKVDDDLATCTYVCPDPGKVKYPPAKPVKRDTNDAVVEPGSRAKVEPPGAEVFVIIMCDQETDPKNIPYSTWYWMMCQWTHKYEDDAPEGERRIRIPVEPIVGTKDRQADRKKAKERILEAYKKAVDKLNELGRPGMIIHATGHGGADDDNAGDKKDFSRGKFDFGAQLGGASTHVLQFSNYTLDPTDKEKSDYGYWQGKNSEADYAAFKAEEEDNKRLLKEVEKEFDRLKVPARVRLLTCEVGGAFDFIHRLAYEWNIWTEGYTKKVHIKQLSRTDWHLGFEEGGRWQEDAGHNLPKTNLFPEPKKSSKEELDDVIK